MEDTGKHVKVQVPQAKALFGGFYLYFPGFNYFNDFGDRLGQPSVHQSNKSPLVHVFNELCGQSVRIRTRFGESKNVKLLLFTFQKHRKVSWGCHWTTGTELLHFFTRNPSGLQFTDTASESFFPKAALGLQGERRHTSLSELVIVLLMRKIAFGILLN